MSMNNKNGKNGKNDKNGENSRLFVDDLLKRELPDDLPRETKEKMDYTLTRFREQLEVHSSPSFLGRWLGNGAELLKKFRSGRLVFSPHMFKKAAITLTSVFFVVVGTIMQMSGTRSVLAESTAAFGSSVSVVNQIRGTQELQCSIRVSSRTTEPVQYDIRWTAPGKVLVNMIKNEKGNEIKLKTFYINNLGVTIKYHITGTHLRLNRDGRINDPDLFRIRDFLFPGRLAVLLSGKWEPLAPGYRGKLKWQRYRIVSEKTGGHMEVTIDNRNRVPLSIKLYRGGQPADFTGPAAARGNKRVIMIDARFSWSGKDTVPMDEYWWQDKINVNFKDYSKNDRTR